MRGINLTKDEEIVIYPSRFKLIMLFVLSVLFVLVGTLMIIIGFEIKIGIDTTIKEGYNRNIIGTIGVICIVFFVTCGIYICKRLIVRKPSIVINKVGIIENASAVGVGLLKWNEIKEIRVYEFMGQKFLGIAPTNMEDVLKRISKYKRVLLKMNGGLGVEMINIPQNTIKIPLEALHDKMLEYMNQYKNL